MARRNSGYWQGRMEALENSQYQRSAAYYQDVQKQFRAADKDMQSDIEKWYQRLADNNDISYAGAKRLLKKNELEEFHWSVKQYIKAGEENAVDKRWMKQLENASARYHISYLEAMKLQTQQHAELLSAEFEDGITDFLHKSYGNQYYHAAFEIAKGTGAGANLAKLNTKTVDTIVKKPWAQDGKNFSDRIWTNKEKLVNSLHTGLTQSIIRGTEPKQAIKNLADTMAVGKAQAGRLVMTESAAIASAAQKDCLNDLGVEKYQILATLDDRTSQICQDLDGEVFDMKDYEVGVTAPPFHPNCRTTTVPYFNDEFTGGEKRAARDGDTGDTYYVPADMRYGDWKKQYVDVERHSPDDENQKRYAARREEWKKRQAKSLTSEAVPETTNNEEQIIYDFKGKDDRFSESRKLIEQLSNEYDSRLKIVSTGAHQAAGDVGNFGTRMRLSSNAPNVAIHEFAHSLADQQSEKLGLSHSSDFWKEIGVVRREYRKDVGDDAARWISAYEHSNKSLGEFFAESFAQAKMKEMGLEIPGKYGRDFTYSQQVLNITNKYFGKSVAKSGLGGIIKENGKETLKMNLQLFAESDIYKQESGSLKRAIHKFEKRIDEHKSYIAEPERHCSDWSEKSIVQQEGLKKHWEKEIRNFNQSIADRVDELRRRGDYND